tara:strand:- start:2569 stop:2955 length:387 start_codon:yes stop_codon:yes gene_type:complete
VIYIIYAALAVLVLLLLVSTWLASRNSIFKKQIRDKSELAIMLSINAKHETDFTKSMQLMNEAEKLKNEIALIVGKFPAMQRYKMELPEVTPADIQAPVEELSIGQLMNKYDQQGNHKVIYAKFNQER